MVLIVLLKYTCFIPCAPPNSVIGGHNVSELIEILKQVYAYASIESGRLKQPQILLVVAAWLHSVRRLHGLFLLLLHFQKFLIYCLVVIAQVLVNNVYYCLNLFHLLTDVVLEVIEHNGYWYYVKDIQLLRLVELLHVQE